MKKIISGIGLMFMVIFAGSSGCNNNPFYPKAELRLVKVDPLNMDAWITVQLIYVMDRQTNTLKRVDTVYNYQIKPVRLKFKELYGGRWADMHHYHVIYTSVTPNFGDTMNFGPLDGGFNLLVPPGGEGEGELWVLTYDLIDDIMHRYFVYLREGAPDTLTITFNQQIDLEGEDEIGNKITWHIPYSTVVYYAMQIQFVYE